MDFSIPAKKMVYLPLSRLVPLFIQQRYDTNPAVRSTCSQKIYLLCLSGVEGLLSGAQKPLNDHMTNLQLKRTSLSVVTSYRTGRTSRTNREAPEGCSLHRLGIGHLRSGDRCTQTRPTPSTPCGSPSRALPTTPPGRRS